MNTAWLTILLPAIDFAIQQAKAMGLDPPGADEIERIRTAVDSRLAQVLPLAIVGVATAAIAVAAKSEHAIDSILEPPRCPKCGDVAVQTISKQVDGPGTVSLSCGCGWSLP